MTPRIELLTLQEVARALKVHPNTIRRWVIAGEFPAPAVIGCHPRWKDTDVAEYVEKRFKAARG